MLARRFSLLKVLDDRAGEWEALAARLATIHNTPNDPAAFLTSTSRKVDGKVGVRWPKVESGVAGNAFLEQKHVDLIAVEEER